MELVNMSICLSDLPTEKIKVGTNKKKYINLVIAKRREEGAYGETHTIFVSSTKEEREANAAKVYVGSGKEYQPQHAPTHEDIEAMPASEKNDDLPF